MLRPFYGRVQEACRTARLPIVLFRDPAPPSPSSIGAFRIYCRPLARLRLARSLRTFTESQEARETPWLPATT